MYERNKSTGSPTHKNVHKILSHPSESKKHKKQVYFWKIVSETKIIPDTTYVGIQTIRKQVCL